MGQKIDGGKLVMHLKDKWKGRPCQMCGIGNWNVSDSIFELREYNNGDLIVGGGPIMPVVPVTCDNCGNTVFVNAIRAGLIESNKK
jgi:RNase P subunit RPR2